MTRQIREVYHLHTAHQQLEGGGFMVRRPFPSTKLEGLDPFLMLDELGPVTYGPGEAIGAPDHPHCGFETVTYLLQGETVHEDSLGHRCELSAGCAQWMTAGQGIVHSELPSAAMLARGGTMHGFQIWVNLPASHKRMPPRHQDLTASEIPVVRDAADLVTVRVLAGEALGQQAIVRTVTPVELHHWTVQPGGEAVTPLSDRMTVGVYVFSGHLTVGHHATAIAAGQIAVLGAGDHLRLSVSPDADGPGEALVLAGEPLGEPVAWYGPFVMNTRQELEKAILDYQSGKMGRISR